MSPNPKLVSIVPEPAPVDELTPEELAEIALKGYRSFREDELPKLSVEVRPTDYNNDLKRGTVKYHPDWRNYSYLTVLVPDGEKVVGCNFTQITPLTQAIEGKNLVLEECNLVNNLIDPSWTLISCNTAQNYLILDEDGVEKRLFVASSPDEVKVLEEPVNVVKERSF